MFFNFATRLDGISGTATREIFKLLSNPKIISFAGGLPSLECLPIEGLKEITASILTDKKKTSRIFQYATTEGFLELRELLCETVRETGINNTTPDNCLIVSGGQQGIDLAFRALLNKGDTVLVENPTYLAVLQMIKTYEAKVEGICANEHGLDLGDLEDKIKTKKPKILYVVPTFSNPTGKSYSVENRKKIVELCTKYSVVIVEDDPYSKLRFSGKELPSLKSFDNGGTVLYVSSFSKTLSPGLRTGFCVGHTNLIRKMAILKQGQDLHTSNLSQAIVYKALKSGLFKENLKKSLPIYKAKKDAMLTAIKKYMPKYFSHTNPNGGLFIWGEFKNELVNTAEKFRQAIEKNVAYIQGQVFYPNNDGLNTLRLNFSTETHQRIEEGIKTLGEIFQ